MNAPELRVSDADRDRAVERLRGAGAEGRLATDELEQRISAALVARTHGDLTALLADLPVVAPTGKHEAGAHARSMVLRARLAAFVTPNVVCLAVWAATGAHTFWPKWVLLVTGVAFVTFAVRHVLGIEDDDDSRPPGPPGLPRPPRLPGL